MNNPRPRETRAVIRPRRRFGSTFWTTGAATKPTNARGLSNVRTDLFGKALDEFLKGPANGLARITAICEELPSIENRVEMSSDKDEFGFPLARIMHSFDQDALSLFDAAIAEGIEIAKGASAKEVWPGRTIGPQHLLGGTIMGKSASDSVVDSFGRAHELPNLYLAGYSIFPTESAQNPTYTLNALSLRGAEHLAANWGTIAG